MIKLKDIWLDLLKEAIENGNLTETYDFTNIHIPSLVLPTDILEIEVEIDYEYKPGYSSSYHDQSGLNETFNITNWKISELIITSEKGKQKRITNINILHKETRKTLTDLVSKNIEEDEDKFKEKAARNYGG